MAQVQYFTADWLVMGFFYQKLLFWIPNCWADANAAPHADDSKPHTPARHLKAAGAHRHVDTIFIKMRTRRCDCYVHVCRVGNPLLLQLHWTARREWFHGMAGVSKGANSSSRRGGSQELASQERLGPINQVRGSQPATLVILHIVYQWSPTRTWFPRTGNGFLPWLWTIAFYNTVLTSPTPIPWCLV